jgi:hypothetical protein
MKNRLLIILCFLPCCFACGPEFGTTYGKAYEFLVENKLGDKTIKIVPKSKTDFWISSSESYVVASGAKIIIGSKVVYDGNKKAVDIYRPDDIIALFDVYIDEIKQDKELSQRKFWDFSLGKVNNSGKYTLIINENTLND